MLTCSVPHQEVWRWVQPEISGAKQLEIFEGAQPPPSPHFPHPGFWGSAREARLAQTPPPTHLPPEKYVCTFPLPTQAYDPANDTHIHSKALDQGSSFFASPPGQLPPGTNLPSQTQLVSPSSPTDFAEAIFAGVGGNVCLQSTHAPMHLSAPRVAGFLLSSSCKRGTPPSCTTPQHLPPDLLQPAPPPLTSPPLRCPLPLLSLRAGLASTSQRATAEQHSGQAVWAPHSGNAGLSWCGTDSAGQCLHSPTFVQNCRCKTRKNEVSHCRCGIQFVSKGTK